MCVCVRAGPGRPDDSEPGAIQTHRGARGHPADRPGVVYQRYGLVSAGLLQPAVSTPPTPHSLLLCLLLADPVSVSSLLQWESLCNHGISVLIRSPVLAVLSSNWSQNLSSQPVVRT